MENKKIITKRKTFIIDTSVLLYDKCAIHSFPDNDTIIPLIVLEELDRFKDKKGVVGENARYVNRYLDDLRKRGNLHNGIEIENKQKVKVAINGFEKVPIGLDPASVDNQIISLAMKLDGSLNSKVILITKDINFRVKCDALGITAQDYLKDKVSLDEGEFYRGFVDVEVKDKNLIELCYNNIEDENSLIVTSIEDEIGRKLHENEFICLKHKSQSFLCKFLYRKPK